MYIIFINVKQSMQLSFASQEIIFMWRGGGAIRFHNNVRNTFIPAGTNVPVVFREYCRSVLMIVFGLASHYVSVHIVTQVDRMNF